MRPRAVELLRRPPPATAPEVFEGVECHCGGLPDGEWLTPSDLARMVDCQLHGVFAEFPDGPLPEQARRLAGVLNHRHLAAVDVESERWRRVLYLFLAVVAAAVLVALQAVGK